MYPIDNDLLANVFESDCLEEGNNMELLLYLQVTNVIQIILFSELS